MSSENPCDTVQRFNDCINEGDLAGLSDLLTADHEFIDSAGNKVSGKARVLDAWTGFFTAFPDYRNVVEHMAVIDGSVVMTGRSQCSDARLDGEVILVARVKRGRLSQWRVCDDTAEMRARLGIDW